MTKMLPEAQRARERIQSGIEWLSRNASPNWELNLLAIRRNGQAHLIANDSLHDECSLALAFGDRKDLIRSGSRVTFGDVVSYFGLSQAQVIMNGFTNAEPELCTNEQFNKMWEDELFLHLSKRYSGQQEHSA